MKDLLKVTGLIFVVFGIIITIFVISFGIRWITAGPKGKLAAREEILSGSERIAAYNHFYDLCASIQGVEGTIDESLNELKTAEKSDRSRIETNLTGLKSLRFQTIAQYNADARKSYTIGQFRSLDLPYEISNEQYVKGEHTTC